MKKDSVHHVFAFFFLGLGLMELALQTYSFLRFTFTPPVPTWNELPGVLQTWFFGLDVRFGFLSLHIDGAWPTLLLCALAYVATRIPSSHETRFV